jgi:hypothetical protein
MSTAKIFKSKSNEEEFCNTSMMSAGAEVSSRDKVVKNNFPVREVIPLLFSDWTIIVFISNNVFGRSEALGFP